MKRYDFLVVGAGLFGSVFAREASDKGRRCLVIDKRAAIGGNCACEEIAGINVHKYGAHIFHTSDRRVWDCVNRFVEFNNFVNSPLASCEGKLYNLPFNMNTFYQLWGVTTPAEARAIIAGQREAAGIAKPANLEEKAISLVGRDIYEKLIKGYTEKQWGRACKELPAFIIGRLPVRFTFDNNYFNDRYQGIPIGGYNALFDGLLEGVEVRLETDFLADRRGLRNLAETVVYTGPLDEYFDCRLGELEYRSLRFDTRVLDEENYQGNAVVNYTAYDVPYTRVLEHKHFERAVSPRTVVTWEYPAPWKRGEERYYTINDERNTRLSGEYRKLAQEEPGVFFGGRLGEYKYYDMHQVVAGALKLAEKILQ